MLRCKAKQGKVRDNSGMVTRLSLRHPTLCVTKTLARQTRHYRISGWRLARPERVRRRPCAGRGPV